MSSLPKPLYPEDENRPELPGLPNKNGKHKNGTAEKEDWEADTDPSMVAVEDWNDPSGLHDIALVELETQKEAIQKVSSQLNVESDMLDELSKPERIKKARRRIKSRRNNR